MNPICRDYSATRTMPDLGASEPPPATPSDDAGLLVRNAGDLKLYKSTALATVDVHTATTRALRVYLESLSDEHEGRPIRFERVTEDWADVYAEGGTYPAAAVWSEEEGTYGGSLGAGGLPTKEVAGGKTEPEVSFLQDRGEFSVEIRARAYCNDKEQRIGVRRMLDNAFAPVSWNGGFYLRAPFHHNAIIAYQLLTGQMTEDADTIGPGLRVVQFKLRARAPWLRLFHSTRFRPSRSEAQIVPLGEHVR